MLPRHQLVTVFPNFKKILVFLKFPKKRSGFIPDIKMQGNTMQRALAVKRKIRIYHACWNIFKPVTII